MGPGGTEGRSQNTRSTPLAHAAFDFGAQGRAITNREATKMLYSMYPSQVQRWINQRGGLTSRMIYLRGKELMSMYHPCYLDAQASATKQAERSAGPRAMYPR